MAHFTQSNWFIWMASIIPGVGIYALGKRKLGSSVALIIGVLFVLFWLLPNLITWYLFGIAYITQVAYAVSLATIRNTPEDITPNSNPSRPLPAQFSGKNQGSAEIIHTLSTVLDNDEKLKTAIVGITRDSSQLMFAGVTQNHFILTKCSHLGEPSDIQRIVKDEVSWVNLKIGERNLFITIEYEYDKKITLHVLGKLRKQAQLILDEFPGTWSRGDFIDEITSIQKENNRFGAKFVYIGCIIFMIAIVFLTGTIDPSSTRLAIYLTGALVLYIMTWPNFVSVVRRFQREPGITSGNVLTSLSLVFILLFWFAALYMIGAFTIALVK